MVQTHLAFARDSLCLMVRNFCSLMCSHPCEEQNLQWPDVAPGPTEDNESTWPSFLVLLGMEGKGSSSLHICGAGPARACLVYLAQGCTCFTWIMEEFGKVFQTPLSWVLKLLKWWARKVGKQREQCAEAQRPGFWAGLKQCGRVG